MNSPKRPPVTDPGVWEKWDPNGNARTFRGTTFVAHVVTDSPFHLLARRILDDIHAADIAQDYGLLPLSSLHMTLLDVLVESDRKAWPSWLQDSPDFPTAVRRQLDRIVSSGLRGPEVLRMKPVAVWPLGWALSIRLAPGDEDTAAELTRFRAEAAELLEIPASEDYEFHSSLGYRLTQWASDAPRLDALAERYRGWAAEVSEIDLGPVAFNVFDDMLAFPPLYYLP
ncbi:MAG: DUF1868 domain-containing protein [Propionibacteriaceae bacterium]|nr:DUF1868 domain-containing protein [Propionibacteriaceae bacterium]